MKSQDFAIIGTIITNRSSAVVVRTIFCCCCSRRVRLCHFIQFNCNSALRPRSHAYVVSVYNKYCAASILYFVPVILLVPNIYVRCFRLSVRKQGNARNTL